MTSALYRFVQRYLIAEAAPLSPRERWHSALAALFGMLLIEGMLAVVPAGPQISYLLAPLGATAVILFALPHSPLAQPWSVAGGLLLSAVIGTLCGMWIAPGFLAIAVALALSIWAMAWLRCLHPPGGAMAVVFAISVQQAPLALATVGLNVLAALFAVLVVNNLLPGRRYPQCIPTAAERRKPHRPRSSIDHDDLQKALARLDAYVDISEDDLVRIYDLSTAQAHQRHDRRCCADIMSRDVISVAFGSELNEAWALLRAHHLHGLPVIDAARRVIGVLTLEDFLRHVHADSGQAIGDNIRRLLRPTPSAYSTKPEVVGQIMRERPVLASVDTPISDMVTLLIANEHPSIVPVVDSERRLVGVLTQTDLLAALYQRQAITAARL